MSFPDPRTTSDRPVDAETWTSSRQVGSLASAGASTRCLENLPRRGVEHSGKQLRHPSNRGFQCHHLSETQPAHTEVNSALHETSTEGISSVPAATVWPWVRPCPETPSERAESGRLRFRSSAEDDGGDHGGQGLGPEKCSRKTSRLQQEMLLDRAGITKVERSERSWTLSREGPGGSEASGRGVQLQPRATWHNKWRRCVCTRAQDNLKTD